MTASLWSLDLPARDGWTPGSGASSHGNVAMAVPATKAIVQVRGRRVSYVFEPELSWLVGRTVLDVATWARRRGGRLALEEHA